MNAAGIVTGTIKHWNADRGFGFVKRDDGAADVFAHITVFDPCEHGMIERGRRISFAIGTDERTGKTCAKSATIITDGDYV
jgi:CspA family cold shock protein